MALRPAVPLHQHRANRLVTAPAVEPVTAAQLRTHLVLAEAELPDAEANELIAEARQAIEDHAGLAFISQTWRLSLDRWPGRPEAWWDGVQQTAISELYAPDARAAVELARSPLQSVPRMTTYDEAGAATVYAAVPAVVLDGPAQIELATVVDVDTYSTPGRITLRAGATWPIATRANNAIEVLYVAGYGDTAADVPATMRRAIRLMASKMHAERGDGCSVADAYADSGAKALIDTYRNVRI